FASPLRCLLPRRPPRPTLFPYTTLFRSLVAGLGLATAAPAALADRTAELTFEDGLLLDPGQAGAAPGIAGQWKNRLGADRVRIQDRKSTRLNSSHSQISYAVFCLKKKSH